MMKRLLPLLILGTSLLATPTRFAFSPEASDQRVLVSDNSEYQAERGYGYEPVPGPRLFSVAVPEGNYLVKVGLGGKNQAGDTTIKAETRRLVALAEKSAAGEKRELRIAVNVRTPKLTPPPQNAPGGDRVILNDRELKVLHWDDKLTLEFNGSAPAIAYVDIEAAPKMPTLFLLGDSTVTDQPGEPAAGWGQMLPLFLQADIAVANHAESGETLKSFLTAHRFDKVLEQLKPGDFVMIQFGHNDSKKQWPQTYADAFGTYQAYLAAMIADIRRLGGTPILVSSMHRRKFSPEGKVVNTHGDYPEAVRKLAAQLSVPLVDLNKLSATLYEALGPERSALAFTDATHHNNFGGFELAKGVVEELRRVEPALAKHLKPGLPHFDPAKPDVPESLVFPASPMRMTRPPRGN